MCVIKYIVILYREFLEIYIISNLELYINFNFFILFKESFHDLAEVLKKILKNDKFLIIVLRRILSPRFY